MALFSDKARVLKLEVTADESADTFAVTNVEYFRTGQDYEADENAFDVPFANGAAAAEPIVDLGMTLPPPTHIVLESTFQA